MLKVNLLLNQASIGAWYIYAKCQFDQSIYQQTQALYLKGNEDFTKFTGTLARCIRSLMFCFDLVQL